MTADIDSLPPSTRRLSAVLASGCIFLAVLLPVLTLYGLLAKSPTAWQADLPVSAASGAGPIGAWQAGAAVVLGMLPVSAMAYGLTRAFLCFRRFLAGRVFKADTVRHLRGFAGGVVGAALAELAVKPLLSLVLTWQAPSGQRRLAFELGSQPLLLLLFGAIVWQFAHAMSRAAELAEDNAQIV